MAERLTDIHYASTGPNSTEGVAEIWAFWEEWNIADANMIGWWEDKCPVTTSVPSIDVKVTVYEHPTGKILLAIGNFGTNATNVTLVTTGEGLKKASMLVAPAIGGYQNETKQPLSEPLEVAGKRGWLLLLQ